jgi:hypothetical protein
LPHANGTPLALGHKPEERWASSLTGGRDFVRQRTAAQRAWKRYQAKEETVDPASASTSHQAWSNAIESTLAAAEALSRQRPTDINDLRLQYDAIWWWIREDDNVLDERTRRWLGRFGRNLRRLAAPTTVSAGSTDLKHCFPPELSCRMDQATEAST